MTDAREKMLRAIYNDLSAADNQDVPLEEYPARIVAVIEREGFRLEALASPAQVPMQSPLTGEWVMVPRVPTETMLDAPHTKTRGGTWSDEVLKERRYLWDAMLASAPAPGAAVPVSELIAKWEADPEMGAHLAEARIWAREAFGPARPPADLAEVRELAKQWHFAADPGKWECADEIESALSRVCAERVCVWTKGATEHDLSQEWITACGTHTWMDYSEYDQRVMRPTECLRIFCPYCAGRITPANGGEG